jgi:hypothetical protein
MRRAYENLYDAPGPSAFTETTTWVSQSQHDKKRSLLALFSPTSQKKKGSLEEGFSGVGYSTLADPHGHPQRHRMFSCERCSVNKYV